MNQPFTNIYSQEYMEYLLCTRQQRNRVIRSKLGSQETNSLVGEASYLSVLCATIEGNMFYLEVQGRADREEKGESKGFPVELACELSFEGQIEVSQEDYVQIR